MPPLPQPLAEPTPVTRPALRYFGGKWAIAPWIVERLPAHKVYVEPFCGAASVLLRKEASYAEVLNDRSGDVVGFFRVLREQTGALVAALECTPNASDEYAACAEASDEPVERARRFFVRSWQGFNGAGGGSGARGFRRCAYQDMGGQFAGAVDNLRAVASRLRSVTIENLDWSVVLAKYDRPATLFYVDPPYLHRTRAESRRDKGYGDHELDTARHMELLDALNRTRGSVALSGYADPLYDLRLVGWERHEREVKALQNGGRTEVLWVRRTSR